MQGVWIPTVLVHGRVLLALSQQVMRASGRCSIRRRRVSERTTYLARSSWMRVQHRSAGSQRLWPSKTAARLTGRLCSPGSGMPTDASGFRCSRQQWRSCGQGQSSHSALCPRHSQRGATCEGQTSPTHSHPCIVVRSCSVAASLNRCAMSELAHSDRGSERQAHVSDQHGDPDTISVDWSLGTSASVQGFASRRS